MTGPAGVQPPTVVVYNATTLIINWLEPRLTNGVLQHYVIKLPIPQFEITDLDQTSLTVTDLEPYNEYNVTVTACTGG